MSNLAPAPAIQVAGNVEGSIVVGDNNFVVNTNHGTIIYKQAAPQVRMRDLMPRAPRAPRGFVGRGQVLAELDGRIAGREAVLVHGGAGIGKTSLLKKVSNGEAALAQMNGVVFLEGVDPEGRLLAWDDVLQMLFDALFESDPHLKVSLASARTYLSNTQPLVLLDGLQLSASAMESLIDLFPNAPVVVSADRAGSGNAFETIKLKPLPTEEAAQLLATKAGIDLDAADRSVVTEICTLLAGVPLALTTTGNIVREKELSPEAVLAALKQAEVRQEDAIQAALERSFRIAQAVLSEAEQRMLAMAAAAPGISASRPWLEAGSANGEIDSQRLESLQLLQANSPRLRLHPEYAAFALENFDADALRAELMGWVHERLQIQSLDFHFLRAELGNLLGLMRWAGEKGRWQDVIALGRALDPLLTLGGLWSAWQSALEQVLSAAKSAGDLAAQAWALHQLGSRAAGLGEPSQAVDLLKRALQIRSRLEDAPGSAFTRHNLEMIDPPHGSGPQGGEPRMPLTPAPPKRRLNMLALFLVVFPAFILGTLTGAYYGCRLEIAPVISALASALQVDSERAAVAFLEPTSTPTAAAGDAPVLAAPVEASPSPTLTLLPSETPTPEPTQTHTAAPTDTATPQPPTPTETALPSDTPSPTPETAANSLPLATVLQQATCRYGPGSAYLYADGLYPQDAVIINGRNYSANWLYVQNIKNDRYCWISASLVQTSADLKTIQVFQSTLPHTTEVSQPTGVQVVRNKDTVTITWDQVHVNLVDARGYLLELTICQNGLRFPVVVQTDATSYEIQDEAACAGESSGLIYSVNTRGYTTPVKVTWP